MEGVLKETLRKYKRAGVIDYDSANQAIADYIDKSEEPIKEWQLDTFRVYFMHFFKDLQRKDKEI